MNDEKYLFISDVRDKSRTARGYHNKRHHAGKAGACKLPSDYLTKKEREKMNGETTTYRINEPMTWAEFKALPDDLKVLYIGWIQEKFGASDSAIAEMFGVHRTSLSCLLRTLGVRPIGGGPHRRWDKEGFAVWAGIAEKAEAEPETADDDNACGRPVPLNELIQEVKKAPILPVVAERKEPAIELIPTAGWMNFEGPADQALRAIGNVLGNANIRLHVSWNPINTEDDQDGGR